MTDRKSLGDLQLAIMRVLWQRGEASSADVHAVLLPERGLAPTTIATMLRKMEDRGLVEHRSQGRQFLYRACVAQDDVEKSMVGDLVERLFAGDAHALLNHLVREGDVELGELDALRAKLRDREQSDA